MTTTTRTHGATNPAGQHLPPGLNPNTPDDITALLLLDRTTNENIKWAEDHNTAEHGPTYGPAFGSPFGPEYDAGQPVQPAAIRGVILPRWTKNRTIQKERTRKNAEVFTPTWVIDKMVQMVLTESGWYKLPLREFINKTWLEITCGEAPYMSNQYDMGTGEMVPFEQRAGFIDRKFQRLNKEIGAANPNAWWEHAEAIYKSAYGFEMQGDSLFIARTNLLVTFVDNYQHVFGTTAPHALTHRIAEIISYNVFQMKCNINKNKPMTYEIPHTNGTVPQIADWANERFEPFGQIEETESDSK